jgi:hypothetical protein
MVYAGTVNDKVNENKNLAELPTGCFIFAVLVLQQSACHL